MGKTKIEWTEMTWNPVTGCAKVSKGCRNCYAERMARRLAGRFGYPEAPHYFDVTLHPDRQEQPLHWHKPRTVFVCSMGDLFHEAVPATFITEVYEVMDMCQQHTFQVLTKRPDRIIPVLYGEEGGWYFGGGDYSPNIWHLVSAENQEAADRRIPELLKLRGMSGGWPVLGMSCEPLLGPVDLSDYLIDGAIRATLLGGGYQEGVDWVIAGGESGPGARPMHPGWVQSLRDQCQAAGVPFFFKQWGAWVPFGQGQGETIPERAQRCWLDIRGQSNPTYSAMMYEPSALFRVGKKAAGRELDGQTYDEMPISQT